MTGALPAGIPGPTATATAPARDRGGCRGAGATCCSPPARMVAVSALGATRSCSAGVTGHPELVRAAYLATDLLVSAVLLPLALATLGSGVLLGLGTRWGLAWHWWVLAKLVLITMLASAVVFLLGPAVDEAAAKALARPLAECQPSRSGRSRSGAGADRGSCFDHGRGACGLQAWGRTRFRRR